MKRDEPDDHDAAWQAIVANYGEPVLRPEDPVEVEAPPPAAPAHALDDEDEDHSELADDPEDGFVPPAPPPLPRPTPDRLLAWLGLFGAPAVLLVFVVAGIDLPRLLAWFLVAWFIAGFLYLVMRMPAAPRDPWDDGAQV